jgi:cysteine synthase A
LIYNSAIEMIGKTPMLKLCNIVDENMADIYIKLERNNPGGSVKDRAALGMIEKAEKDGLLKKGYTIVEPTSGNTGISLAMIGRLKGYNVIIVMPESMSIERRNMIAAYGAELVLTEAKFGMQGAIDKAHEIAEGKEGFFIPGQFDNEANPQKHYETTAEEILADVPDVDVFIAGVGSGGTLIGVGKRLKEVNKNVRIVAMEPKKSDLLSGGKAAAHKIQGIGANFIPKVYDKNIVDEVVTVTDDEAYEYTRLAIREEGIFVGISSGANIAAAVKIAKKIGKGKKVVTVAPDGGEKYMSTGLFD